MRLLPPLVAVWAKGVNHETEVMAEMTLLLGKEEADLCGAAQGRRRGVIG